MASSREEDSTPSTIEFEKIRLISIPGPGVSSLAEEIYWLSKFGLKCPFG